MFAEGLVSYFVLFAHSSTKGTHIFKVTPGAVAMATYRITHNPLLQDEHN
jgi:hypothetical protein